MEAGGSGWNDPPNLSYQTKSKTTTRKNLLNKRIGAPDLNLDNMKPESATFLKPGEGPPPLAPKQDNEENTAQEDEIKEAVEVEEKINTETLQINISETLLDFVNKFKEEEIISASTQKSIESKIKALEKCLDNSDTPKKIEEKMKQLAFELTQNEYDKAWVIHTELICDFPSNVTHWMVGIKKIITESRKLKASSEED